MHLNINSQILAEELRLLNKIVPSKPAIQILNYILFKAGDGLTCYATDLEVGLVTSCEADVREQGQIAIPAQKLLSLVEQFPDDDVSIMRDKTQVVVRCGKFTSRLQILPTDDFPTPPVETGRAAVMSGPALAQAIAKTRYALSSSGPRYAIQGALLTLIKNGAAMVGTDGKRLALTTMRQEQEVPSETKIVIPAKTLDALLPQLTSDTTMTISDKHCFFRVGERLLISRMIEGKFPKYEAVVPQQNDKRITIERTRLASALRRVKQVSDENKAMLFDISPGFLRISSSSVEIGSADEVLDVNYEGPPLTICVDGEAVLDFVDAASHPNIVIALKDNKTAMLLLDGDKDSNYLGVIMLMRVK